MNWSRRAVLRSGAAMIPTLAFPSGGQAERFAAGLLTLVLESPQWPKRSPLTLHAFEAFARRGLPVAVAFESQDDGRGGVMAEPLPGAIQAAGLIELVAPLPEIVGLNRYEQMRAAADHRANLSTRPPDGHPVVTLIARSAAGELDWSAFRSAGFRVIIVPDGSPAARAEVIGRDQLRLVGGAELSFAAGGPTLSEQTEAAVVGNTSSMLVLSLAKLGDAEDEAVTDQIDELAGWLSDKVAMGELVMVRPMDHLLQSGQLIQQQVALLVDVEESSEESGAALLILLDEAGIPVTLLAPDTVLERLGRPRDCRHWAVEARTGPSGDAGRPPPLDGATCVVASPPAEVTASSAARVLLVTETGSQAWTGLRGDGRFRATLETWSSQGPGHSLSPLVDRVLRIDAASMETPQRRSALLRTLTEEAASGRIRFWALPEWSEHLLAPDPLLTRYWNARSRLVSDPPRSGTAVDLAERDELIRDARAAWRYIERHTDDWTGLCATTVQGGAGGRVNSEATLWDVGSQIQGILGAARLGLIPQKDCVDRIALIVRNIPTADIHGLRLPPAIFRANDLSPVRPEDFDLCDLGRFLIALDSAVDQGVLPPAERDRVWMSWDIDAAVHDGRIHTFDNGRWRASLPGYGDRPTDGVATPWGPPEVVVPARRAASPDPRRAPGQ